MAQIRQTIETMTFEHCRIQIDSVSWESKNGDGSRIEFIVYADTYEYQGKEQKNYKLDLKYAADIIKSIGEVQKRYSSPQPKSQPTAMGEEW